MRKGLAYFIVGIPLMAAGAFSYVRYVPPDKCGMVGPSRLIGEVQETESLDPRAALTWLILPGSLLVARGVTRYHESPSEQLRTSGER